jgi:hypothetical protein
VSFAASASYRSDRARLRGKHGSEIADPALFKKKLLTVRSSRNFLAAPISPSSGNATCPSAQASRTFARTNGTQRGASRRIAPQKAKAGCSDNGQLSALSLESLSLTAIGCFFLMELVVTWQAGYTPHSPGHDSSCHSEAYAASTFRFTAKHRRGYSVALNNNKQATKEI